MRRIVVAIMSLVLCGTVAQANIMLNPGFEDPDAGGAATNWWTYGAAGTRLNWAVHNGSYGAAFFTQGNTYGGIGQDVSQSLNVGDVLNFDIYGKAETGYDVSDTCIVMQFFTGGTETYALTNNVYSQLTSSMDTWNSISVAFTNTASGITMVKPILTYSECTITEAGMTAQWDDADLTVTAIPEPSVMALAFLSLGLIGLLRYREKR